MDTTEIDTAPAAELLVLRQVARIVSRGDDAESRIQDILRHLDQSLGLVRGRVLLANPEAGEIFIRYAHGLTPAELERGRYRIGEGVSGRVFQTGAAALVANVHDEPGYLARAVSRDALPPEQIAFIAVPVVRDHLPVGVLAAHRLRNSERPAQSDLALFEVIATLIGQILCVEPDARPQRAQTRPDRGPARAPSEADGGDAALGSASRDLMLGKAEQWHRAGRVHQATDMYLRVAGQHPGSRQALVAKSRLLQIAQDYEARGASRMALDVIARLQGVIDGGNPGGGQPVRGRGAPEPSVWDSSSDFDVDSDEGSGGIRMR